MRPFYRPDLTNDQRLSPRAASRHYGTDYRRRNATYPLRSSDAVSGRFCLKLAHLPAWGSFMLW